MKTPALQRFFQQEGSAGGSWAVPSFCLLGKDWGGRRPAHSKDMSVAGKGLASFVVFCGLIVCALSSEVSLEPIGNWLPVLERHWYFLL